MVASDYPSFTLSFEAASPTASSTFSLDAAVTCSSAEGSSLWQFTAIPARIGCQDWQSIRPGKPCCLHAGKAHELPLASILCPPDATSAAISVRHEWATWSGGRPRKNELLRGAGLEFGAGKRLFWRWEVEQFLHCCSQLRLFRLLWKFLEFPGQGASDSTSNARGHVF